MNPKELHSNHIFFSLFAYCLNVIWYLAGHWWLICVLLKKAEISSHFVRDHCILYLGVSWCMVHGWSYIYMYMVVHGWLCRKKRIGCLSFAQLVHGAIGACSRKTGHGDRSRASIGEKGHREWHHTTYFESVLVFVFVFLFHIVGFYWLGIDLILFKQLHCPRKCIQIFNTNCIVMQINIIYNSVGLFNS